MEVRWLTVMLDTPAGMAQTEQFWQWVTGTVLAPRRGERAEFATLVPPDGDAFVRVQRVESGDARCHLGLHVDDVRAALAHTTELGAAIISDRGELVILESPGGQPFCLLAHRGEKVRPRPLRREGHHSLVDQVCLDIPPAEYEREATFWAALCGWRRGSGSLREFEYLARPAAMPLRLLLQKLDDAQPGQPVRAHVDIACDDVETEAALHMQRGAAFVRRRSWTTLRDPAGREYCITSRNPFTGTNP